MNNKTQADPEHECAGGRVDRRTAARERGETCAGQPVELAARRRVARAKVKARIFAVEAANNCRGFRIGVNWVRLDGELELGVVLGGCVEWNGC